MSFQRALHCSSENPTHLATYVQFGRKCKSVLGSTRRHSASASQSSQFALLGRGLVVWMVCGAEVVEREMVCLEWKEGQESEGRSEDVEEVCHRRRQKRELGEDEAVVWAAVEKDGENVGRLALCGSSRGCGDLPGCRLLAVGDGEVG